MRFKRHLKQLPEISRVLRLVFGLEIHFPCSVLRYIQLWFCHILERLLLYLGAYVYNVCVKKRQRRPWLETLFENLSFPSSTKMLDDFEYR